MGNFSSWLPVLVALIGVGVQALWFSAQFGALQARIEEHGRRLTAVEMGGSPALQTVKGSIADVQNEIERLRNWRADQLNVNLILSRDLAILTERSGHAFQRPVDLNK